MTRAPTRARDALWVLVPAVAFPLAAWLWLGDVDLNLADEGFLWHGVLRTLEGRVPILDFQAYDPGRYYALALLARVFGDGVLGLRAGLACFQALGLAFGLATLARALPRTLLSKAWLVPAAALLQAWMFPLHKAVEPAAALAGVWAAARLVERPSLARHAGAGLVIGVTGLFGRNLALYQLLGIAAAAALVAWKTRVPPRALLQRAGALLGGTLAGYAPLLLLVATAPGFGAAFVESLADTARGSNADYALPWPWPWRLELGGLGTAQRLGALAVSAAFALPVVVLPVGLIMALTTRAADLPARACAIGASLVGACFVHHVAARSDSAHLAQCIHPVLVAALALPLALTHARGSEGGRTGRARTAAIALTWLALAALTFPAVRALHPGLVHLRAGGPRIVLRERVVAGDRLRLPPWTADYLRRFERVLARHVPAHEPLLIAPFVPGLYPVSGRAAPVWTSYFLFQGTPERERRLLAELERAGVDWAWITTGGVDGRRESALDATHPLLWAELMAHFEPVADPDLASGTHLLHRRAEAGGR